MALDRRSCMLVHEYYPRDFRVRREVRALAEAGLAVDVVCLRENGQPRRERLEGARILRAPIRRHRGWPLPVYLAEYLGFTAVASAILLRQQWRSPYRVVHVHAPPDFLIGAAVWARLLGSRVVLDIHDLTPELYLSRFSGRGGAWMRWALEAVERGACEIADRVITVTDAFQRLLVSRGVPEDKTLVLRNCPDPFLFCPRSRRKRDKREFLIVHHGTLVHRYGVDLLVDAFLSIADKVPGARLEIFGDGDWLRRLKARVEGAALQDRVILHGEVAQEVVAGALARADLCVVPNRQDGFTDLLLPTKLLEALQVGCPVVASATRLVTETFGSEGGVRLVPPGDVARLSEAIIELASNRRALAALEREGRKRASQFCWIDEKQKLLRLYDELGAMS